MLMNPANLEVYILVWAFIYFYTLCMRAVEALSGLRLFADSPEPSLLPDVTVSQFLVLANLNASFE